jgi:hypothetical protein
MLSANIYSSARHMATHQHPNRGGGSGLDQKNTGSNTNSVPTGVGVPFVEAKEDAIATVGSSSSSTEAPQRNISGPMTVTLLCLGPLTVVHFDAMDRLQMLLQQLVEVS